jgi:hypothetical protein
MAMAGVQRVVFQHRPKPLLATSAARVEEIAIVVRDLGAGGVTVRPRAAAITRNE